MSLMVSHHLTFLINRDKILILMMQLIMHIHGGERTKGHYLINNPRMFNLGTDNLAIKPYIPHKVYFNEFAANVLRDSIGIANFDL